MLPVYPEFLRKSLTLRREGILPEAIPLPEFPIPAVDEDLASLVLRDVARSVVRLRLRVVSRGITGITRTPNTPITVSRHNVLILATHRSSLRLLGGG